MKRIRPKDKETGQGDWRHAIFRRVVSPTKSSSPGLNGRSVQKQGQTQGTAAETVETTVKNTKRTTEDIRKLWKDAICQQILLNRMDKQNHMLKAQQEEVLGKRVKLSYQSLGVCDEEASDTWDLIMSRALKNPGVPCDLQLLDSAILRGIPKYKRGQVWQFFMQQRKLLAESNNWTKFSPQKDVPYAHLRRQLTSHQHAILIDLGRTFPSHPFFCDPLGTGQLALFNLLKAYSILDPDVGYCQGLSFVAGILLMHYEEEEAFSMLKYFMFDLGAREHYKPEMGGLQVKLYQLTRMIHDHDAELHLFLDEQDILPTLYAAPWFLTMFAAHFSVGFAVRVLDVVFLHGLDIITKFAVLIIVDHKNDLMKCNGLEQIMDCFRHIVTQVGSDDVDRYLKKVLETDSDKQLLTYAAEYSVMHNESFLTFINNGYSPPTSPPKGNCNKQDVSVSQAATCGECLRLRSDVLILINYLENLQYADGAGTSAQCPPEVTSVIMKYRSRSDNEAMQEFKRNQGDAEVRAQTPVLHLQTGSRARSAELYSSSDEKSRESSPSSNNYQMDPEGQVESKNIAQKFLVY